jgi:ribosomal protein L39E
MTRHYPKKVKLAVHGNRVKWTPVWAVLKKYGQGKRVHPSRMTRLRRNWRQTKLKLKPRRVKKQFIG